MSSGDFVFCSVCHGAGTALPFSGKRRGCGIIGRCSLRAAGAFRADYAGQRPQ